MVKYALLVGINYLLTPTLRLNSSYNDVIIMSDYLQKYAGFKKENIIILTDISDYDMYIQYINIQNLKLNSTMNPVNTETDLDVSGNNDTNTKISDIYEMSSMDYLETSSKLYDNLEHQSKMSATFISIVKTLKQLLNITTEDDSLFLYFSGHGSQVPDMNGDENDKKN